MGHGPPPDGREVDEGRFLTVLGEATAALEAKNIPYVIMGGIISASLGRPRGTNDIDLFVQPENARLTLEVLEGAGFTTEETDPRWLFKGFKDDILVDVIFRSTGDIYLDEEMMAHARVVDVRTDAVADRIAAGALGESARHVTSLEVLLHESHIASAGYQRSL